MELKFGVIGHNCLAGEAGDQCCQDEVLAAIYIDIKC